jgi:hypothetical protein
MSDRAGGDSFSSMLTICCTEPIATVSMVKPSVKMVVHVLECGIKLICFKFKISV